MNKEQELREAIRAQIKELHGFNDLDNPEESTTQNVEEVKEIIKTAIRNSNLYKDSNKERPEETVYKAITQEYNIVEKNSLKEDHSEFLDKVEDITSGEIVESVSEIILNLRDIQKKLLKFRPKLIDEVAQATLILEGVQNKLSDGEPIGEQKASEHEEVTFKSKKEEVHKSVQEYNKSNNDEIKIDELEDGNYRYSTTEQAFSRFKNYLKTKTK